MPHFFIKSENIHKDCATIDDIETYRHVARSLRAKVGEKLLLIDENEIQYETEITEITPKTVVSRVLKTYKSKRKLDFNLYLAQSPLRSEAQSILIEKATELGVCGVYPVITDNCAVNRAVVEKKIPKWQKIMFEASKQCERANIPTCFEATSLEKLILKGNFDHIIAFCERLSVETLRDYISKAEKNFFKQTNILVIIGPEGGFSEREFDFFKQNGVKMLTLGDLILKADTAVTVALGNIIYEYNSFKQN